MKVRTKAFIDVVVAIAGFAGLSWALNYFFPKYGFAIYLGLLACWIIYCLFEIRVGMLKREQNKVVDILKE